MRNNGEKLQVIYMGEKKELKIKHPEKAYTRVHTVGDWHD